MDRREALKISSLILGYSLTGTSAMMLLNGCKADPKSDWTPSFLSGDELQLVAEISEMILPKTDTPGAKDAQCDRYIDTALFVFAKSEEQEDFRKKLHIFDDKAKEKFAKAFLALNQNEKEKILDLVVADMKTFEAAKKEGKHIFRHLKELTISGYCTSEVGVKGGLLDFRPVPGPYQGCIDYSTIGKTWAL